MDNSDAHMLSTFVSQQQGIPTTEPNKDDFTVLRDFMQAGKVTPVINRSYKSSEAPDGLLHVRWGHWRNRSDPIPFALAEYNAGARPRAALGREGTANRGRARHLSHQHRLRWHRKHVDPIMSRYDFYKRRGRM